MDRERLFGDAKATAHAIDTQRRRRELDSAKAAYEADPTVGNKTALARALFENGRFEQAERLLVDLVRERGDDIQVVCDLAFAYKNLGHTDQAAEMFKRVIEIDTRHPLGRCAENELWMLDPRYVPSWMREEAGDEPAEDEGASPESR
jgi:Flp pilus assembly protein TadD